MERRFELRLEELLEDAVLDPRIPRGMLDRLERSRPERNSAAPSSFEPGATAIGRSSPSRTTGREFPRTSNPASSIRSSPPRNPAKEPARDSRSPMPSSTRSTAEPFRSTPRSGAEPGSTFGSRWTRRPPTRTPRASRPRALPALRRRREKAGAPARREAAASSTGSASRRRSCRNGILAPPLPDTPAG
jgi:hypothetical protein